MAYIKKYWALMLGLALPMLMIGLMICIVYVPGILFGPKYNFLYLRANSQSPYYVQDGKLKINKVSAQRNTPPPLFVYDVKSNSSRMITYEEASEFYLYVGKQSPDGFEMDYGLKRDGYLPFFYWSKKDTSSRYLKGTRVTQKLEFRGSSTSIYIIGWIQ